MLDQSPFRFRGVGCSLGARPATRSGDGDESVALDVAGIAAAGYNVVSVPRFPRVAVDGAEAAGLRFLLEPGDLDLSRIIGASRRERLRLVREARTAIRRSLRSWSESPALLGLVLRRPASAHGHNHADRLVSRVADELADALHSEHRGLLALWRERWPLNEDCPPEFDCLVIDCELPGPDRLGPAIMAAHGWVGDRPLVLGEVALTGAGQRREPDARFVIDTALRCGAAGTLESQLPAPHTREEKDAINRRTVGDLEVDWPAISIVVTAHNAGQTLAECLSHCERLEYPELEVIVIDDGSTDDTAEIARACPRARLITLPPSGLAAGRNAGYRAARGELIAYLDADAYPSPEWPWYLALAAKGEHIGGAGGPNVPPPDEPTSAQIVARSPGGPVPALRTPDRATHLPGCNVAFWRHVLQQLGGFDPDVAAGDDIEFEWRVAAAGYEIAYHPAALVWHRRRPGLGPYLRQQRHYGRGQANLERRFPERLPTAYRVRRAVALLRAERSTSDSANSSVRYLTLPRRESAFLELAHQWGMPLAALVAFTAPLAPSRRKLRVPATAGVIYGGGLFAIDAIKAGDGRRRRERRLAFRTRVALYRLLRPLAFRWGHLRGRLGRRPESRWPVATCSATQVPEAPGSSRWPATRRPPAC